MNNTNNTSLSPSYSLYTALLTQCDSIPPYFEDAYFGIFGIIIITAVGEFISLLMKACKGKTKKTKIKSEWHKKWDTRIIFVFTFFNIGLVFVGLYDYFSQGLPSGSPTCGFMFTMSLPLYKPLAAPLWRTLETMMPFFFEEREAGKAFVIIFFFFGFLFIPISVALFFFVLPLIFVFIPAALLTWILLLGIYLLMGCLFLPFAGDACRADKLGDFCALLPISVVKAGTFIILGWLIFFAALFGSFYHGASWNSVFNYSKNYLDFSDVIPSFSWPSNLSPAGQFGAGAGVTSAATQSLAQLILKIDWWSEKLQAVSTTAASAVKKPNKT